MKFDFRFAAAVLLLMPAGFNTWQTSNELSARRELRTDLAEIGHVRYGMFNADEWVRQILPILNKQIDALDLVAENRASLLPMVEKSLYRLLDDVKEQVAPKPKPGDKPNFAAVAMATMATGMINNLRPQVPQFARSVMVELGSKDNKQAIRNYIDGIITEGAKNTFSPVDMTEYRTILRQHGCVDAAACRVKLGSEIAAADGRIEESYLIALTATALAFCLLLIKSPPLQWYHVLVMLLFCVVLLVGGVLSPMLEVEATVSRVAMTFFGEPLAFNEQVFYYQSKSVLEVFRTLLDVGQPQMDVVAILLLMFSVVFPVLKILTLGICLGRMEWLRKYRVLRFFALESSKWSMADVLALSIFMAFVAFNGVISSAMGGLQSPGAQIVVPTDSSKILGGFYLFVGFVIASLFLSWRLTLELQQRGYSETAVNASTN